MTEERQGPTQEFIPIRLETLHLIDHGALGVEVNKHITAILRDISNRKMTATGKVQKRTLTIKLEFTPRVDIRHGERTLVGIDLENKITCTVPEVRSSKVDVRIREGQALFNRVTPEAFNEQSLPFPEDEYEEQYEEDND